MTTIGGFVDGMIDGTIPLDQRDKYLKIIAEETKRLSRMVNRMLDAAKIQSGELILSPAPFDFTEMTAQILLSFEQKIEKKKAGCAVRPRGTADRHGRPRPPVPSGVQPDR